MHRNEFDADPPAAHQQAEHQQRTEAAVQSAEVPRGPAEHLCHDPSIIAVRGASRLTHPLQSP
jgi:hypothetical protein